MRKKQLEQAAELVKSLGTAHDEIKNTIEHGKYDEAAMLLTQCQEGAIELGKFIESQEGEQCPTVRLIENYCELAYGVHEDITQAHVVNGNKIYKKLRKCLIQIENSVTYDIPLKREIVFLPYKVSMWDSLESIYLAAREDKNCDAYVIPIPYYDLNPDGSLGREHYEGDLYPDDIPITPYDTYDFGIRRPDMIFIHNPYDECNMVTRIHPFFFSDKMKKCTDCLVYVPYFATTGGQAEGQALLPAYINADYIVIQAKRHRDFYDSRLPDGKFLPFGSPKFDSVIRKCNNPPSIPESWKAKMYDGGNRKKVFFYNTTVGGVLGNTMEYFQKIKYVFDTFKRHPEVCLIWRPHPLLESTFESMRPQFKPMFDGIKRGFIEEGWGIYDDTPSIEDTIALSDIYIGDDGTSVISLFGVAGKPIFAFNNSMITTPNEDDWKSIAYMVPRGDRQNKYCIMPENKLYYSPDDDLHYHYFCDLNEYSGSGYYLGVYEYNGKVYVMPGNAQDILVIDSDRNIIKIELKKEISNPGAFNGFWFWEDKIYLLPFNYPNMVILDLKNEKLFYLSGVRDFFVGMADGVKICAARWIWDNKLCFLNPEGNKFLTIDIDTYETKEIDVPFNRLIIGAGRKDLESDDLWLLPYEGAVITKWNPKTGEIRDYDLMLEGMASLDRRFKIVNNKYMFASMAFMDNKIIFSPNWGNKFVELNIDTGKVKEWISPLPPTWEDKSVYCKNGGIGGFIMDMFDQSMRFFYAPERKTYDIDLATKEIKEVEIVFDKEEVLSHSAGFAKGSDWNRYICYENVFNTLEDLITDNLHGSKFDRDTQLMEYMPINASPDGDCGEKVYKFLVNKK